MTLPSLLPLVHLFKMLPPDWEPALDLFLPHGDWFSSLLVLPGEGMQVFGSTVVSNCLLVAGCWTDTSTGGRHKLTSAARSATKLLWVEASRVSTTGVLGVWVPASLISLDLLLHLHKSELWVWASTWRQSSWALWLSISWLLFLTALSWQATFSINLQSFILGFRSGVWLLGWACLCFWLPCEPWFGLRLSAQQAWSICEQGPWRLGLLAAWWWHETRQHSSS